MPKQETHIPISEGEAITAKVWLQGDPEIVKAQLINEIINLSEQTQQLYPPSYSIEGEDAALSPEPYPIGLSMSQDDDRDDQESRYGTRDERR